MPVAVTFASVQLSKGQLSSCPEIGHESVAGHVRIVGSPDQLQMDIFKLE
jgi:hypothetical protein